MEDYKYALIRARGYIYRVEKGPFESNERTMDRGWYIVQQNPKNMDEFAVAEAMSHRWVNEKYWGMKYADAGAHAHADANAK